MIIFPNEYTYRLTRIVVNNTSINTIPGKICFLLKKKKNVGKNRKLIIKMSIKVLVEIIFILSVLRSVTEA